MCGKRKCFQATQHISNTSATSLQWLLCEDRHNGALYNSDKVNTIYSTLDILHTSKSGVQIEFEQSLQSMYITIQDVILALATSSSGLVLLYKLCQKLISYPNLFIYVFFR